MPTDPVDPEVFDGGSNNLAHTPVRSDEKTGGPGYELSDVNVNGVVVFLSGLLGFVFIFFIFCFFMGRVINVSFLKQDGPPTKWQRDTGAPVPSKVKGDNLVSNPEMDQQQLHRMTTIFPTPRLQTDDGNQDTADMHAREDLLLNHYSSDPSQPGGVRIPIDRAMQLILERGLPVAPSATPATQLAGAEQAPVQSPLTTGFARTGYELDTIEARKQRRSYDRAAGGEGHAALVQPQIGKK